MKVCGLRFLVYIHLSFHSLSFFITRYETDSLGQFHQIRKLLGAHLT